MQATTALMIGDWRIDNEILWNGLISRSWVQLGSV